MKICVFSDSHGNPEPMIEAVMRESPDQVFFLGDGERDLQALYRHFPYLPVAAVRGNCDLYSDLPSERICTAAGFCFFVTHGHRFAVKTDRQLEALRYAAVKAGAQAALFGHTHTPYLAEKDGLILLNPGAIGRYSPSYAAIEIRDGQLRPELRTL